MTSIINTYDQLREAVAQGIIPKTQAISISYHRYEPRGMSYSHWSVYNVFYKLETNGHWRDGGEIPFSNFGYGVKRSDVLLQAQVFCKEHYGISAWRRNGMGDYVPSIVQEKLPLVKRKKE